MESDHTDGLDDGIRKSWMVEAYGKRLLRSILPADTKIESINTRLYIVRFPMTI